jgi:hypothetical protein
MEASVVKTWVNFLEDTWQLQSSYNEQKENKTKYVITKSFNHFVLLLRFSPYCEVRIRNCMIHCCCDEYCDKYNMFAWFSFTFCLVTSWKDAQAIFWSWPSVIFLISRLLVGYMLFKHCTIGVYIWFSFSYASFFLGQEVLSPSIERIRTYVDNLAVLNSRLFTCSL